ncbi:MAG TPA: hypothetical protein VFZ17_11050 [Acidimicrobiia bacterium]|nr:hypothetical protein [Acidimicrobiia bacterium]
MLTLGTVGAARAADSSSKPADPDARTWTQVTDATDGRNTDEVGLARSDDDVLHVLWRNRVAPSREEVRHTSISTDGEVSESVTASGPFASVGNPVVVVTDDGGLRTFFSALTGSESDLDGVLSAASDDQGEAWTTNPTRVSSTTSAIPEGVGAAVAPDGTPAFVYAYSFVLGYHSGLDPATLDVDLVPGDECCAYLPNLTFADDEGVVAWYSNTESQPGYLVQTVSPATTGGANDVPAFPAPDPAGFGTTITPSQRTPLVTRAGTDEIYMAYCSGSPCEAVVVWQVGAASARVVGKGPDIEKVNIATDPDGRLWVMWQDAALGKLFAVRSNEDASVFGAQVVFEPTDDTETVWKLAGSATADQLDVVASLTTADGINAWHTSVLPGLHVEPKRSGQSVTLTVTDAGAPVKGAKITYKQRTVTTNAKGKAIQPWGKGDRLVSKEGYTTATVTLAGGTAR